jgi:hypothetical protein
MRGLGEHGSDVARIGKSEPNVLLFAIDGHGGHVVVKEQFFPKGI